MNFPDELKSRQQWLIWRFIYKPGVDKPSKVPYYPNGHLRGWPAGKPRDGVATDQQPNVAQGNDLDRAQLVDFESALEACALREFDGVGFAFLPDDGLIGIDLDGMQDDPERMTRASSIIDACNTFTETSPSGKGVHIIGYGTTDTFKSNALGIEVYCGRQFFTMTGNTLDGRGELRAINPEVIDKLRRTVKGSTPPPRPAQDHPQQPVSGTSKIESALAHISPDLGYDEWIRIGMAIHAELGDGAMSVWDHWSSRGASYKGGKDIESHWRSFKPGSITGASLFKMAMDNGWRPPRPAGVQQMRTQQQQQQEEYVDQQTGEIYTPEHANDNVPAVAGDPACVDWFSPFPDVTPKGRPLATIENLNDALRRLGVTVRYNVISKDMEILIPGQGFSIDNRANASLAWLVSACKRFQIPTDTLGEFLTYVADQNPYNPVANWITSRPWDGVSRLNQFYNTIRADGEEDDIKVWDLKAAMLKRWLLSAVAGAFRPNGVSAHGVLVLQGDQYMGKTAWFKSLVPAELGLIQDGLMLRPDDRDSVKQVVSHWLVELGELDATFRKSDIAQLKAFITRDKDTLRRAYAKMESQYARRTVFFASVNPRQFLHDPTGNRRYWTISCTEINHKHGLDMQQVWAEVYAMYQQGESWYLTPEEMAALNGHNKDYEVLDPIRERLQTRLDWQASPAVWRWMTATDIMMEIGFDRPTRADVTQCGQIIQELNGAQRKKSNGKTLSAVPPRLHCYPEVVTLKNSN